MQQRIIQENQETYVPHPHEDIIENVPSNKRDFIIHDYNEYTNTHTVSFRAHQLVWFILGIIETLLVFRFVFKMIGANTYSGFTDFVYTVSYPFAAPFLGILPANGNGAMLIEWSTLIGMVVYLVIAYGLIEVIHLLTPLPENNNTRSVTKRTRYAL